MLTHDEACAQLARAHARTNACFRARVTTCARANARTHSHKEAHTHVPSNAYVHANVHEREALWPREGREGRAILTPAPARGYE
eukprot:5004919-Pleurochrysis_carterae.AAC.1